MSDATDGGTDEELAADVDELADVLRELRGELAPRRRGPFGLPAPPSPGELLRFADERAIPFAIAVLEANIRALELLQGAIRLAESGRQAGEEARRARGRAASLGRASLERLDAVLSDLESAASEGALPNQPEARDVLQEARRLRDEVDDALAARVDDERASTDGSTADGGASTDDPTVIDVDGPAAGEGGSPDDGRSSPAVDVEGELRSIKEELGKLDRESPPGDRDQGGNDAADGNGDVGGGDAVDESSAADGGDDAANDGGSDADSPGDGPADEDR